MQTAVLPFLAVQERLYQILIGTYFIKAVLSCYRTVAQVHERLPITNNSNPALRLPVWKRGGLTTIVSAISLDWGPYLSVMRVAQRVECGSHAAAPAVLTIRHLARH
ncbi:MULTISPECIES: hypothetical protein [Chloroflexus]|jgi:hypothetical protein|uniref:hypothetical protein n=1 Tax=Chloroflexus TaxID=1107 RepID=UPI000173D846|nr:MULTISPECIES: hypothetical protein [Chloroflexus]GIV91701.1 MAG: hypothetical protein KatS3mg056_0410 [Chloroflexus sp.]